MKTIPSMNPFHEGEVRMQKIQNVHEHVMSYAPLVIRPFMPDQHRQFFSSLPFLVAAARDTNGNMWSTLIFSTTENDHNAFVTSPDPATLEFNAQVAPGDALEGYFQGNMGKDNAVGILGIELAMMRQNRVNGRIVASNTMTAPSPTSRMTGIKLTFAVDQSFGNCPQYISPRDWWWHPRDDKYLANIKTSHELSESQTQWIQAADTIFIATGYRGDDDVDGSRYFGNDASHRGGPAGFLRVQNSTTLLLPDFSGNNHYNSIGNLFLDARMGLTVPAFSSGALL
jgi:uncharacterized protein